MGSKLVLLLIITWLWVKNPRYRLFGIGPPVVVCLKGSTGGEAPVAEDRVKDPSLGDERAVRCLAAGTQLGFERGDLQV